MNNQQRKFREISRHRANLKDARDFIRASGGNTESTDEALVQLAVVENSIRQPIPGKEKPTAKESGRKLSIFERIMMNIDPTFDVIF